MNTIELKQIKDKALSRNKQLIDGGYGYNRLVQIDQFVVADADPLASNPKMTVYQQIEE